MIKKIDYSNEVEIMLRADSMLKAFERVCDAVGYNLDNDEEYCSIVETMTDIDEGEIIFSSIVGTYLLNTIQSYITITSEKEFLIN